MTWRIGVSAQQEGRSLGAIARRACWLALLTVCLGIGGNVASAQSVFPVRLDGSETSAVSVLTSGALKISTANHYQNRLLISVTADTPESILRIESPGITAISVRMSATSFRTDGQPFVALREELYSVSLLGGGAFGQIKGVIEAQNADLTFPYILDSGSTGDDPSLTLRVDTPPNHDRVLLWVEVFASTEVVFTELF